MFILPHQLVTTNKIIHFFIFEVILILFILISRLVIFMALAIKGIFVIGAKRTPFCKYGGSLQELPASQLFAAAGKDALQASGIQPSLIDSTIIGNVNFLSQCDGGKTPRYCGIYSGVPIDKPALGVNKACGSGLQAVISGAIEIFTGQSNVVLTGGTEVMSTLPFLVRNIRFGSTFGKAYIFEDYIKNQMTDSYTGLTLHQAAENTAKRYNIARELADDFALKSHQKLKSAQEAAIFKNEITVLTTTTKKKSEVIDKDDLTKNNTNMDDFIKAPAICENGRVVTVLNSAAPADGAAAVILADESSVINNNVEPLARVTGISFVGVDPQNIGLGAAAAIKKLLEVTKLEAEDVNLFEINETFACETLSTMKELKIHSHKVNPSGGALSQGHPAGASGARLVVRAAHHIHEGVRRVVAASSCGGGQGVAVMFETA